MKIRLFVALTLAVMVSGCGASAVGTQARAATVAAVAAQGAGRLIDDAATAEARATCPTATFAPNSVGMNACLAPLRARWAPADAALGVVKARLRAWVEALDLARLADSGVDLWGPLATAAARLVADWEALRVVLEPLGVDLPALPAVVTAAAAAIGGM